MKIQAPRIFLFLLFFVSQLFSQDTSSNITGWKKSAKPTVISVDLNLGYGSNSIDNEFLSKILWGGHIDSTLKNRVSDRLANNNRLGFEINYELKYFNLKDTFLRSFPDYRYYFGFGSFTNVSISYKADFFRVLFYGNKGFEGKSVDLNKTNFFISDFKKLSFGVTHLDNGSSIAASLIIGNNHQLLNINSGELYTEPGGGQIDLVIDGIAQQSDSLANGYLSFSGAGAALDFNFRILESINFSVQNLGFGYWKRNPTQVNFNDTIQFSGFQVDDIFTVQELDINSEIDSLLPKAESKAFIAPLPTIIEANSVIRPNKKLQPYYGARYKLFSNYFPYLYLGGFYSLNSKFRACAALSYGGYNNLEAKLNLYYSSQKLYFAIGTNNLIGSFNKKGLGRSIMFSAMLLM